MTLVYKEICLYPWFFVVENSKKSHDFRVLNDVFNAYSNLLGCLGTKPPCEKK